MKYPPDDPKLTAYALGELDPGETAAVAAAIENSAECGHVVEETRETAGLLTSALQTESCPELSATQRAAIETAVAKSSKAPAKRKAAPAQPSFLVAWLAWRPQLATVVLWATACLIAVVGWGLWVEVFCKSGHDGNQRVTESAIKLNSKPATPQPPSLSEANQLARQTAASPFFLTPVFTNGALVATDGIGHYGYTNFNTYALGDGNGIFVTTLPGGGTLRATYGIGLPMAQTTGGSGPGATAIAQANSTAPLDNAAKVVNWNTFNGGFDITDNKNTFVAYGNTLTENGAGTLYPTSVATYNGGVAVSSGSLVLSQPVLNGALPVAAGNTYTGPTFVNAGDLTLNFDVVETAGKPTENSSSGTYKLGANTLVLNGNNSYSGGTILGAGRITYSGPTLISQGTLILSDLSGISVNCGPNQSPVVWAATPYYATQYESETYALIRDNPFLAVAEQPLSTFSIDVDTASYSNVRRFLLQGRLPPPNAVRIEEMINYFTYDYAKPKAGEPFSVNVETVACPWAGDHRLVRIGLKGREVTAAKRPPCNLVFLIDVSGSMGEANKLSLIKPAMRLLVEQLTENERVAIVVFNDTARVVLASTSGDHKQEILDAMESLKAGGCTNGGDGLRLAYDTARRNFIEHGVNRVILCTDGDFNAGNIVNLPDLTRLIERERQTGVFLTALGFGMGNLKDATLERLADKGNGHYAYIDTFFEARKVLVEQVNGTLVTIAKDVKIQVEFNPVKVAGYRLIGYEDRLLRKEDFNNDRKDAGEIGAGHTVTALYEIVPAGQELPSPPVDPLKYQPAPKPVVPASGSTDLLTVKLRYKQPDGDKSALIEQAVNDSGKGYAAASRDFKFVSAVAAFGMVLRDSPHKGNATLAAVLELAEESRGPDASGYRTEFLSLVKKAQALGKR